MMFAEPHSQIYAIMSKSAESEQNLNIFSPLKHVPYEEEEENVETASNLNKDSQPEEGSVERSQNGINVTNNGEESDMEDTVDEIDDQNNSKGNDSNVEENGVSNQNVNHENEVSASLFSAISTIVENENANFGIATSPLQASNTSTLVNPTRITLRGVLSLFCDTHPEFSGSVFDFYNNREIEDSELIGNYSGRWGMNELAFSTPNGVLSDFYYSVKKNVKDFDDIFETLENQESEETTTQNSSVILEGYFYIKSADPKHPNIKVDENELILTLKKKPEEDVANVVGSGENKFGLFRLFGTYNVTTNRLNCYREYLANQKPKKLSKRKSSFSKRPSLKRPRSQTAISQSQTPMTPANLEVQASNGNLSEEALSDTRPERTKKTPVHLQESLILKTLKPEPERLLKGPEGEIQGMVELVEKLIRSDKEGWFLRPVDAAALNLTTYHDIIKTPMDLGTIQDKIKHKIYGNFQEIADDVRLVFTNATKFNPPGHPVHRVAAGHLRLFERDLKQFERSLLMQQKQKVHTVSKKKRSQNAQAPNSSNGSSLFKKSKTGQGFNAGIMNVGAGQNLQNIGFNNPGKGSMAMKGPAATFSPINAAFPDDSFTENQEQLRKETADFKKKQMLLEKSSKKVKQLFSDSSSEDDNDDSSSSSDDLSSKPKASETKGKSGKKLKNKDKSKPVKKAKEKKEGKKKKNKDKELLILKETVKLMTQQMKMMQQVQQSHINDLQQVNNRQAELNFSQLQQQQQAFQAEQFHAQAFANQNNFNMPLNKPKKPRKPRTPKNMPAIPSSQSFQSFGNQPHMQLQTHPATVTATQTHMLPNQASASLPAPVSYTNLNPTGTFPSSTVNPFSQPQHQTVNTAPKMSKRDLKELTYQEKRQLGQDVNNLSQPSLLKMIDLLRDAGAYLGPGDEIELDIEKLDTLILRKLQKFVRKELAIGKGSATIDELTWDSE